jgi:hypothetical protein
VVDNLSADGTCDIARQYPVQLIANRENRALPAAGEPGVAALRTVDDPAVESGSPAF